MTIEVKDEIAVLELQNFQSYANAKISLVKGLNTVVGNSNSGKSGMVRALRALLYNDWDQDYIRKNPDTEKQEKICVLTLTFSDAVSVPIKSITLIKPENKYILQFSDGTSKTYPKVGKDTPSELKLMGFDLVTTERDDSFNLNFQGQLDPLFLLGEDVSGVLTTSLFNALFKISPYERALRDINTDTLKLTQEYNQILSDVYTKTTELESLQIQETTSKEKLSQILLLFNNLQDSKKKLNQIETIYPLFEKINTLNVSINNSFKTLEALKIKQTLLKKEEVNLANISKLNLRINNFESVNKVMVESEEFIDQSNKKQGVLNKLFNILEKYSKIKITQINDSDLNNEISKYSFLVKKQQLSGKCLNLLLTCLTLKGYQYRESKVLNQISESTNTLNTLTNYTKRYNNKLEEIIVKIQKMEIGKNALAIKHNTILKYEKEENTKTSLKNDLQEYLKELKIIMKICPTCGETFKIN